jgi:hypothetical protein
MLTQFSITRVALAALLGIALIAALPGLATAQEGDPAPSHVEIRLEPSESPLHFTHVVVFSDGEVCLEKTLERPWPEIGATLHVPSHCVEDAGAVEYLLHDADGADPHWYQLALPANGVTLRAADLDGGDPPFHVQAYLAELRGEPLPAAPVTTGGSPAPPGVGELGLARSGSDPLAAALVLVAVLALAGAGRVLTGASRRG